VTTLATLDEVFGIRTHQVRSYVERDAVDLRFQRALEQENHIVIYGSSKQGKTALWQKHLESQDAVVVRCTPRMDGESVYQSVLRQTGIQIKTIETTSKTIGGKVTAKVGFEASIPLLGKVAAETGGKTGDEHEMGLTWEFIGYDLGEAQSIGELLKKSAFAKFVVLENFHYLTDEAQRQLAYDLKTFHELGIRFVILGIWQDANLLLFYNGDLQDRVTEIPVEPWKDEDFDRIIAEGSRELEITIDGGIRNTLKASAYRNVGLLQELLRVLCEIAGVWETQPNLHAIADMSHAERAISQKLDDQTGQLLKVLQTLAGKSRTRNDTDSPLILPYYLVQAILKLPIDQIRNGISKQQLQTYIQGVHYRRDGPVRETATSPT
jgi:hypothetical protein